MAFLIELDEVDELAQIRNHIDVVWLALQSGDHLEACREALACVVGNQHDRLKIIIDSINERRRGAV